MQSTKSIDDVCGILTEIRDGILQGNEFASQTAKNTRTIRQDVSGIRLGQTGPDAVLHRDPLTPAERRQVNLVKARYTEKRSANPHYSLLSISRAVRREDHAAGVRGGYKTDLALNSRASLEIKREDAGRPPF